MISRLAGKQKLKKGNPKRSFLFQKIKFTTGSPSRLVKKLISKNGKRHLRQAERSAIRFLIIAEAFKRMAASHVHTRLPVLYPEN